MTKIIVAIGGGEIGRIKIHADGRHEQKPVETVAIDNELIKLSGKKNPKMLFIGAASSDSPDYITAVQNHFADRLGMKLDILRLTENPTQDDIREKIMGTDIVYIGGGDTRLLIDTLRVTGTDKILHDAYNAGIIMSGTSAGAICWFDWYDNEDYIDDMSQIDVLPGLGYIPGFAVPHWNEKSEDDKQIMRDMLTRRGISGIALDNATALISEDGHQRTISSLPAAHTEKIGK